MKKYVLIILVLSLAMGAVTLRAEGWRKYKNSNFGFSLSYPAEWKKGDNAEAVLALTNPDEEHTADFTVVADILTDADWEAGFEAVADEVVAKTQAAAEESALADLEVTDRGEIEVNGVPAYKLSLMSNLLGLINYRQDMFFVRNGNCLILLSFAAEEEAFDYNSESFAGVRDSFKLTGKPRKNK